MVPTASTMVAPRIARVFFIVTILSGKMLILGWMPRFDVAAIYVPVSLFAGVLHDADIRLEGPGFSDGPGSRVGFGIVHGIRVLRMPVVDAPEGIEEARLIAEGVTDRVNAYVAVDVTSFDDQLISLPLPKGLAEPRGRQIRVVGAAIGRDNVEPGVLFR